MVITSNTEYSPRKSSNLTKEQLEKFEPLRNRFHTRLNEISSEIRGKRFQLIDLLAASDPDREAIRRQQEKGGRLGEVLVQLGLLTDEVVTRALANHLPSA